MEKATIDSLRRAAEALPPGSFIMLPCSALLKTSELTNGAEPISPEPVTVEPHDRLLKVSEVAERLGVSRKWVYDHADSFPFTRRLGGQTLRFSERGLERWLAQQR